MSDGYIFNGRNLEAETRLLMVAGLKVFIMSVKQRNVK